MQTRAMIMHPGCQWQQVHTYQAPITHALSYN